jgi:hypothetical protein
MANGVPIAAMAAVAANGNVRLLPPSNSKREPMVSQNAIPTSASKRRQISFIYNRHWLYDDIHTLTGRDNGQDHATGQQNR